MKIFKNPTQLRLRKLQLIHDDLTGVCRFEILCHAIVDSAQNREFDIQFGLFIIIGLHHLRN